MPDVYFTNEFSGTLNELGRVRNRHGGAPNEGDLVEAAKALNRLQEMYRLDVGDFVRGNIAGQQTGAELSVKDAFYLGRFAALNDAPGVALKWLEEAAVMAASEAPSAAAANNTAQEKNILQALRGVERKLPPGFRDIDQDEVGRHAESLSSHLLVIEKFIVHISCHFFYSIHIPSTSFSFHPVNEDKCIMYTGYKT